MELNPAAFNAHFSKMGHTLAWRKSYACPCLTPSSGQARSDCVHCNGKGRLWDAEVEGRCGFTAMNAKKGMADFGVWEEGDSVLSIGSDCPWYNAGRFDRFRSTVSTHTFTDNLRRGFGDRLSGSIVCIDRVFWLDDSQEFVEGGIPAVADNGALTWAGGVGEPPPGTVFSIAGTRYDEYFAYLQIPQNRPIHGAALPKKLPVRRFDLFGR